LIDADRWQEIASTLRRNKLRTFLTACGVFWGVFMLLAMLGFGRGLQRGVSDSMFGMAANSAVLWGQRTTMPHEGMRPGRAVRFDNGDAEALRTEVPGLAHVAPSNQLGRWGSPVRVTRGSETGSYRVRGDYPEIAFVQPMLLQEGRFLNDLDLERRRKVAVIGSAVRDELFAPGEAALGERLRINGVYFQVVGIFESFHDGDRGHQEVTTVYIPFTTFQQAFNYGDRVGWFGLLAKPDVSAAEMEAQVREVLKARHRIHPNDEPAIGSWNGGEMFEKVQLLFLGIELFIWFVGVMTLLAGVVGVSNIMLISVKERTREIGVRKALGATPRSITALIVQEAVALTALAGYAGVIAAVGALELAGSFTEEGGTLGPPEIDLQVALVATVILIASGAIAGWIPARHAARVSPVEALRAE
jgi:putative ABC transport system permease protein